MEANWLLANMLFDLEIWRPSGFSLSFVFVVAAQSGYGENEQITLQTAVPHSSFPSWEWRQKKNGLHVMWSTASNENNSW